MATTLPIEPQEQAQGHLAALFTIAVWGVTFISTKILLVDFSPLEVMFYRLALATLALFIASPPPRPWAWPGRQALRAEGKIMAAGLCGVTLYFLFQNLALSYTLAANVSVLISVTPLLTALVSRAILKEKLKGYFFLGFSLAMAGIILIAFNGSRVLKLNPLGDLLSILAALSWAFYSVLVRQISAQGTDMRSVTRKVFAWGLLFTLPVLSLFDFHLGPERLADLPALLHLLFLGVVASALCYFTWNFAVGRLGPVKTSVYLYMVPVITIVAAALVLGERITLVAGAGMALILAGMAVSERGKG